MVSLGIDWPLASAMDLRRRGLPVGSPPPIRAATVSSLMSLVKSFPRLASRAPFLCLIVAHFECPLISAKSPGVKPSRHASTTAAVLAGADHDQQIWRRPNESYGEAVGITHFRSGSAATPSHSRFAGTCVPPVRSDLSGRMAASMIDLPEGFCDSSTSRGGGWGQLAPA